MSTHTTRAIHDPARSARIAAAARSILACPDGVSLVVDGLDDVMAGLDGIGELGPDGIGMQDLAGTPTFSCPPGIPLAQAAREGRRALLTVASGLGARGGPERDAVLTLAGALRSRGTEECACCAETREVVSLEMSFVMLARTGEAALGSDPVRVPVEAFASAEHHLNRGFLQRSIEHANACHQDELRRAVSTSTGTRLSELAGVALADLRPDGVELRWVEASGAHTQQLRFPRTAATSEELGELLRDTLHPGLC